MSAGLHRVGNLVWHGRVSTRAAEANDERVGRRVHGAWSSIDTSDRHFIPQVQAETRVGSGLERDDAYRLVQRHAMRAWDEELDFRALTRDDAEIASRVDLDGVFDESAYTRNVDHVFDRLHHLTKEPVHA